MKGTRNRIIRWGSLVLLMGVFLSVSMGGFGGGAVGGPDSLPGLERAWDAVKAGKQESIWDNLHVDFAMLDLSAMAREEGEFLLTPTFLVQEAISDDVILTYPGE